MVPHSEFISHIARTFGESHATIMQTHRVIREAGLIEGKQGRHSPARTTRDAAIFVSWIGVTDKPADAPAAITDFGYSKMIARKRASVAGVDLPTDHTLIDMLSALLDLAASPAGLPAGSHLEFDPSDLSAAVHIGHERFLYTRDDEDDADDLYVKHARPYRVTRHFPITFLEQVAIPFRQRAADAEAKAA